MAVLLEGTADRRRSSTRSSRLAVSSLVVSRWRGPLLSTGGGGPLRVLPGLNRYLLLSSLGTKYTNDLGACQECRGRCASDWPMPDPRYRRRWVQGSRLSSHRQQGVVDSAPPLGASGPLP